MRDCISARVQAICTRRNVTFRSVASRAQRIDGLRPASSGAMGRCKAVLIHRSILQLTKHQPPAPALSRLVSARQPPSLLAFLRISPRFYSSKTPRFSMSGIRLIRTFLMAVRGLDAENQLIALSQCAEQ